MNSELAPPKAEPEVVRETVLGHLLKRRWLAGVVALIAVSAIVLVAVRKPHSSSDLPKPVLASTRATASQVRLTGKTQAYVPP